jgi:hypothetical protein
VCTAQHLTAHWQNAPFDIYLPPLSLRRDAKAGGTSPICKTLAVSTQTVTTDTSRHIKTDSNEDEFHVRFLKDDGVGLLTTKTDKSYLVLDSLDYWYDLIQTEYPKKKKCSCKSEWFKVQFDYVARKDTSDFRKIKIITTCTNCGKTSKAMSMDIDYSPTDDLLSHPLTYCEKPSIKYKFSELTSYWADNDLNNYLNFIFNELKLNVYCWFFKHPEGKRYFQKVSYEKAVEIITVNHRYLDFFFSEKEINADEMVKGEDEKGVYLKQDIWRKNELIELSSPFAISGYGLLYYTRFCTQHLDKGEIVDKSKSFENITNQLKNWLADKFISKRGTNCFDGQAAFEKFAKARTINANR